MKLNKEQKEKLIDGWYTYFHNILGNLKRTEQVSNWWINQIEQLEEPKEECSGHTYDCTTDNRLASCKKCGKKTYCRIFPGTFNVVLEEPKEDEMDKAIKRYEIAKKNATLDRYFPVIGSKHQSLPDIEEIELGEPMSMNSSRIEDKLNQIIKTINTLKNKL